MAGLTVSARASQNVSLAWDANSETNIAGYRVKYGTASGSYAQTIDVGNSLTAVVPNLAANTTFYFVVTAYNTSTIESSPSAELTVTTRVNQAPSVSWISPVASSSSTAPANLTLTAAASDSDGSITKVEYYNGATKLGEATASPYSLTWSAVGAGSYNLLARAIDNDGATMDTAPVRIYVTPAVPTPPSISGLAFVNGTLQLTYSGDAGRMVTIFATTDFITWMPLTSSVNASGTTTFSDPASTTLNQRFYRVLDGSGVSDAAGFIKLHLAGAAASSAAAFSYLGTVLNNPAIYQGMVSASGAQWITDTQSTWLDNQFNGANGEFYLEILSGPRTGLMTDILTTTAGTHRLTIDDDLSSQLTGGEFYRIRKHRTLGEMFGRYNEGGLAGGATVSTADEVRVFNPVTQVFVTYYFKTGGFGGTGWRATTDAVSDASRTKLYPDQGVVVKRKTAGALTVAVTGEVKTGATLIPVGSGMNIVANLYPAGSLTLGNSGLHASNDALGLAGGVNASAADEVRIYDGAMFRTYFYKTGGFGGIGWRETTDALADASAVTVPVGSAVILLRKNGRPPFGWTMPQPF